MKLPCITPLHINNTQYGHLILWDYIERAYIHSPFICWEDGEFCPVKFEYLQPY